MAYTRTPRGLIHRCLSERKRLEIRDQDISWCLPNPDLPSEPIGVCILGEAYGMKFRKNYRGDNEPMGKRANTAERLLALKHLRQKKLEKKA